MAIPDRRSRERLEAIGIEVWQQRDRRAAASRAGIAKSGPRIRLASGSGDWLVVLEGTVPEKFQNLVADITAAIGPDRCRFGQWAHSSEAGVAAGDWTERGIEHVLVFGGTELADERLIAAGDLEVLAEDGSARRRLWQQLKRALKVPLDQ